MNLVRKGLEYENTFNDFLIGGYVSYGVLNTRPGGGQGNSIRNLTTQIRISYFLFNL